MSWMNDIVTIRPEQELPADGVSDNVELFRLSESYDEYILRCACAGVEPIFARSDFEPDCRASWT